MKARPEVEQLRGLWQALASHDCLACDAPGPDGPNGGECSTFERLNEAVAVAFERTSRLQRLRVWHSLQRPRCRIGLTGEGPRRWA